MSSPTVSTFQSSSVGIEHGQVRLAAGRGEGAAHVLDRALGGGQLEDQHVLGQPALVAGHHRGDAQSEALLAEQRVAAVAGAVGPDLARLGEVDDVLVVGVAGPGDVLLAFLERHAHRVQAGHEVAVVAERVERAGPHPGHDPHRCRDVGRVGQLHADVGDRRAQRPHREGHHVHGAPAHRAAKQPGQRLAHLARLAPVVGRARVLLALGADEGPILDSRHVARVRAGQVGVGPLGVGELLEGPGFHQRLASRSYSSALPSHQ